MLQDPVVLYKTFQAVKLHFTTEYDFVKYNGGCFTLTEKNFTKRKDKALFYQLAKILPKSITVNFFIAQFIENTDVYILNVLEDPILAQKNYTKWKKRISTLKQNYISDIEYISNTCSSWRKMFERKSEDYPLIFKYVTQRLISHETYSLIDILFDHIKIEKNSMDNMYSSFNYKYKKYESFLLQKITIKEIISMTPKELTNQ